ncbi:hypothetical protein EYF80_011290 [Liparis tanakae]|uniref:Uncharacterized protein n=1 Tax=Liparis tanakae TaxID=230148 RepID=A0A4Z2IL76_9TELE|nr:hypothetical protein EYF80_011290 [Liparis tanakae]
MLLQKLSPPNHVILLYRGDAEASLDQVSHSSPEVEVVVLVEDVGGGRVQNSDKMMDALWFKQSVLPRAVLWKTFCETADATLPSSRYLDWAQNPAFHPALQLAGSVPQKEQSGRKISRPKEFSGEKGYWFSNTDVSSI